MPFIEELVFRLYLRFRYNYLGRLIILLASVAGKQNKSRIETYLTNFWASRFKGIFYLSAIIFGFVHLANFEYSIPLLLLSPILVAPQFIGGLFFGYLRVKYTLALGYFMHAIHNAIFILVPLIFMSGAIEKLTIKNNDYSLRIEEPTFGASKSVSSIYTDSVSFKGTRLNHGDIIYRTDKNTGKEIEMMVTNGKQLLEKGDKLKRNGEWITDIKYPEKRTYQLNIGDVCEIQVYDGQIILLNRQPTQNRVEKDKNKRFI